ncbi:hypothetical protein [Fodinibius sp.]|uniref:hypothetical protein n=1 Tax=Fodinibius sp. TaxID=1872440 RepID=UPI002ACE4D1B|nr:hypothetical protein [Fodinibius sp.]MDZ7660452.1 hypothetical protein [Fodinibius sp.]
MKSSINHKNSIAERIIFLSNRYSSAKEFLTECGINNYSLITDLKYGRIKKPGSDVLAQIVIGSGCNGTWLLTGKGEMFTGGESIPFLSVPESQKIDQALTMILNFGSKSKLKDDEARSLEIKVAEALLTLMKKQPN